MASEIYPATKTMIGVDGYTVYDTQEHTGRAIIAKDNVYSGIPAVW